MENWELAQSAHRFEVERNLRAAMAAI